MDAEQEMKGTFVGAVTRRRRWAKHRPGAQRLTEVRPDGVLPDSLCIKDVFSLLSDPDPHTQHVIGRPRSLALNSESVLSRLQ